MLPPLIFDEDEIPHVFFSPQYIFICSVDARGKKARWAELQLELENLLSSLPKKIMAAKTNFHARSNSLPSRPHPFISEFDEHMCRLGDSQATSTSSSSMGKKLISLQDLHDCVDKLLHLPLTQQVLVREHHRKCVDELLDGSLKVLDLCSTTKDALLQTKDSIHQLQSVIRRRQEGLESEIKKYISSRKIAKKTIRNSLKNLKSIHSKPSNNEEPEILSVIREAEAITLASLESFLSFMSEPKSHSSKPRRWSLVSKLMHQKRVACSDQGQATNESEFAEVDAALDSLIGCKSENMNVEDVQNKLNSLELCIQDLEDGIECFFWRMIRNRASFLNIFN